MSKGRRPRYTPPDMTEIILLGLLFLFVILATVVFIVVYYWGPKDGRKK